MLSWTQDKTGKDVATGAVVNTKAGNGGPVSIFMWCPTARNMLNTTATGEARGNAGDSATRTSSTPFMRGLKENIVFYGPGPGSWEWRRIIFRMRGPATDPRFNVWLRGTQGISRYWKELTGTAAGAAESLTAIRDNLFAGQIGLDWNDYQTAPTDNKILDIVYDKKSILQPNNADEISRRFNQWIPMNKTLMYDDDENGGVEGSNPFSAPGKRGMGDMYILDFFSPGPQASTSTTVTGLNVYATSTLYWHEK